MYGVNKVILVGTVGADCKVRNFDDGGKLAQTRMCTTKKGYKLQNGTDVPDRSEWHNIVFRGGLAKIAEKWIVKGTNLYVEGELTTRKYTGKDNAEHYVTEVNVNDMHMLPSSKKQEDSNTSAQQDNVSNNNITTDNQNNVNNTDNSNNNNVNSDNQDPFNGNSTPYYGF